MTNSKRDGAANSDIELVVSDIHHRISGVSATVRALVPALAHRFKMALIFTMPYSGFHTESLFSLLRLLRQPVTGRAFRIWHVRRNNEMFWALLARDLFRCKVKLVFTSAAIRRHSWYPRQLIKRMDAIVAVSQRSADWVAPVVAIVPHGVDIKRFESGQTSALGAAPWLAFAQRIGIVGRVRPEKGTDLFVSAMIATLAKHPERCAVIVGKTTAKYQSFKKNLQQQIDAAGLTGQFFFIDELPYEQMPDLYASLEVVCAPALYEGFGLVPIEAMVSGTAIVASRTGAYEDMVLPGETGELVNCGDGPALTLALTKILAEPGKLQAYQQAGQRRVRAQFSLANEIEGLARVYQQLWDHG
jgi:mannosyltransferase